jgi:hypothetical protein
LKNKKNNNKQQPKPKKKECSEWKKKKKNKYPSQIFNKKKELKKNLFNPEPKNYSMNNWMMLK